MQKTTPPGRFLSYCIISDTIYKLLDHFQSIFASFSPDIQANLTIFTEIIAISVIVNSLKNPENISVYSHIRQKKKMKKTQKSDKILTKFGISRQI